MDEDDDDVVEDDEPEPPVPLAEVDVLALDVVVVAVSVAVVVAGVVEDAALPPDPPVPPLPPELEEHPTLLPNAAKTSAPATTTQPIVANFMIPPTFTSALCETLDPKHRSAHHRASESTPASDRNALCAVTSRSILFVPSALSQCPEEAFTGEKKL